MSRVKTRTFTFDGAAATTWQAYVGPGLVVAAVLDYTSTSSAVLTFYDNIGAATNSIYARTSDTDAGTTVPISLYTDGALPATYGTASANVKAGIPFHDGLYAVLTGDTTAAHTIAVTLFIKPLIRKTVNVATGITAAGNGSEVGAETIFSGPGQLHGLRVKADPYSPSTQDWLLKDSPITAPAAGTGSGNTILTATDFAAGDVQRATVTLTGSDEAGNAVTTAATGAYASPGLFFTTGLNISVQQSNTLTRALSVSALIEA